MEINLAAITVPFWNTWSSWEHPHTSPAADGAHSFLAGAGTCAVHLLVSSVKKLVLDLMSPGSEIQRIENRRPCLENQACQRWISESAHALNKLD